MPLQDVDESQPIVMAKLYRMEVGQTEDGSTICHSIVYLPSDIIGRHVSDGVETPATEEVSSISDNNVHSVSGDAESIAERQVSNIGLHDVRGKQPISTKGSDDEYRMESTYNIVMVDTSDYMNNFLPDVMEAWNEKIAENLDGVTDIYSFSSEVHFKRSGTTLDSRDRMGGESTNLTRAIKEIHFMIHECPHEHVRVFLVTGGAHTRPDEKPQVEIDKMSVTHEKRVEVFLLRIERSFPDDYSLQIRSKLHTGAASIPTLFWAKEASDIPSQIEEIGIELNRAVKVSLSEPANTVPFLDTKRNSAYPGEYLYFDMDPEILRSQLRLKVEHEPKIRVPTNWRLSLRRGDEFDRPGGFNRQGRKKSKVVRSNEMTSKETVIEASNAHELAIDDRILYIPCSVLYENLYRQWNAVLIQINTNGQTAPLAAFELMKSSFKMHSEREAKSLYEGNGEKVALRKCIKSFDTLMKTSNNVVSTKYTFTNELELVEAVLNTTVRSKYDYKLWRMKLHSKEEWGNDVEQFKLKLIKLHPRLKALPKPSREESCRILMCSFLGDLQDPVIFDTLYKHDKLHFLKEMNFTGIPIYVPVKGYSQINPWTLHINNICVSPFEILSQKAMESAIALQGTNDLSPNKEITLIKGDPTTVFNAIVPVIPKKNVALLKPLLRTNVFSVGCTFCILKNANIVDHTCHIAALGCVWMKTITDFPLETRPAYIKNRIANVEATARIYLDRQGIQTYIECLLKNPEQALCTESAEKYNDATIKCESLVKPAFFLHLSRHNYALLEECQAKIPIIIQRVVMEFLGRCLSSYDSNTPYVDFFLRSTSGDSRDEWIKGKAQEVFRKLDLTGTELFRQHCELNALKKFVKREMQAMFQKLKDNELGWRELIRHEREKVEREAARRTRRYSSDGSDMETNDADDEPIVDEPGPGEASRIPKFVVPKPNMEKISRFRKSGSVGQVSLEGLRTWAIEMMHDLGFPSEAALDVSGAQAADEGQGFDGGQGGPDKGSGSSGISGAEQTQLEVNEAPHQVQQTSAYLIQRDIDYAFGDDMLIVYLVHALNNRDSRARSRNTPPTVTEAIETLEKELDSEWNRLVDSLLGPKLDEMVRVEWLKAYTEAHSKLARPLTPLQIIEQAQARGIEVSMDTFNDVYRYRVESGLCRNCCQVEACPHYLVPNRRFNLHLEVEREQPDYPHTLHLSVSRLRPDVEAAVRQVTSCAATGTNERKKKKPLCDADSDKVTAYVEELQKKYDELK